MPNKVVIVESPAKAKTLSRILGKGFIIKASMGHVRDLPKKYLGVDIEQDFTPRYNVVEDKKKVVRELKEAVNSASSVYLATDPDREGEAISWHVVEAAKLDKDNIPIRRVSFHEITKEAVENAFSTPRSIDMHLVNAQQARRILDRLVGYKLSPLLWRKVRKGLSAGRVQSSALKLIVDREKEIEDFIPQEYWTIKSHLAKLNDKKNSFWAELVGLAEGKKLTVNNNEQANAIVNDLEKATYSVAGVLVKETSQQPAPPFITSTMQQEAWRKLRFTAERTMRLAQQLYEGLPLGEEGSIGLITYMRTDSTQVAQSALNETRDFIVQRYGKEFLPSTARRFVKKAKHAQEAHEAIRPTRTEREPETIKSYLSPEQFKLYSLIWKRMVASQMAAAKSDITTVDIVTALTPSGSSYRLRATSSVMKFPGFTVLYTEGKDDEDGGNGGKIALPELMQEEVLRLLEVSKSQNFTKPPPRYTEATLVKALEQKGIGRPSTYASIISVVQQRDYVKKVQGKFYSTELGTIVNDLLKEHFPVVVDLNFTAHMEENLDRIARGDKEWISVLRDFYTPFEADLDKGFNNIERIRLPDEPSGEICPKCNSNMVIKSGRYGKFLACSGYPKCHTTRPYYVKLGIPCPEPECSGELIERESKKKRIFYGCTNFPDCRFTTGRRPISPPCPSCNGLLTLFGKGKVKCVKCNYTGALVEEEVLSGQNDVKIEAVSAQKRRH